MTSTQPVRQHKGFAGMVYPDPVPTTMPDRDVTRVHMFDIPTSLREHACTQLDSMSGGAWWTIGEFRYEGEDYGVAVARRALRGGRMAVEYGVESD